jgi:hypothetical protein
MALCAVFKRDARAMTRILEAEGVALRNLREALQVRDSLARQHRLKPDAPLGRHDRIVPATPKELHHD